MIKQHWLISEEEKNRILNLHESATKNLYIIKEQNESNKVSFNISNSFPSGKFKLSDTSLIDDALSQIQNLLKTGKSNFDTIVINSSESKVPNEGVGMNPGDLSRKRGEEVSRYIKSKIGNLVNIRVNDLKAQGPEWDESKGSDHPDYTKYQYVTLNLSAENSKDDVVSVCDFTINQSGGQGIERDNYITLNRPLKDYGELSIDSDSIPDRMVVVNKQNVIVSDTGYVATGAHQYSEFKYVPSYVYSLTLLNQIKKNPSVSGNKLITINVNSFEELISKLLVDPSKISNKSNLKGELSVKGLQTLFERGIRTFVLYSIGGPEIGKIPFDSRKGDSRVIVYSPVGQTGYTITGNCPQQQE
jgi:hypothetical protein